VPPQAAEVRHCWRRRWSAQGVSSGQKGRGAANLCPVQNLSRKRPRRREARRGYEDGLSARDRSGAVSSQLEKKLDRNDRPRSNWFKLSQLAPRRKNVSGYVPTRKECVASGGFPDRAAFARKQPRPDLDMRRARSEKSSPARKPGRKPSTRAMPVGDMARPSPRSTRS
jgi:hypothetical protein